MTEQEFLAKVGEIEQLKEKTRRSKSDEQRLATLFDECHAVIRRALDTLH